MPTNSVMLSLSAQGVEFEAGINDARVLYGQNGEYISALLPLNLWLLPQGNRLTVRVRPLAADVPQPSELLLEAKLVDPDLEDAPSPAQIQWKLEGGTPFEPFSVQLPFTWPELPETFLWHHAQPLSSLTAEQAQGARQAGLDVLDALARKDIDRVMELLEFRVRETAMAFRNDLARARARNRQAYAELADKGGVRQVKASDIELRPAAGGRAFELTVAGGDLVDANDGTMPIFVSLVEGKWVVSR